jgi:hypothetical protein
MSRRLSKGAALGAIAALMISATPADAGPTLTKRARVATRYLASHQEADGSFAGFTPIGSTADAVLSFVAAKRGPKQIAAALEFLRANIDEANNVGRIAKVVLAVEAAGADARDFGGRDLIKELRDSQQQSGQYGADTAEDPFDGEVINHALAILALEAAGQNAGAQATSWLINAQCRDGGWQYSDPPSDTDDEHCDNGTEFDPITDTNTTSYALQAIVAGVGATDLQHNPYRYLRSVRDPRKGGWGFDSNNRLTDTNSTALVIQAYAAVQRDLPQGAMRALKGLQFRLCGRRAGAFSRGWSESEDGTLKRDDPDVGATIGAILGLLRDPLPVEETEVTKNPPRRRAC